MAKLGIAGRGAASDRLRDAADRGFLKLVEPAGGYGRTSPRIYEIGKTSEEIAEDNAEGDGPGVFPSPDEVENEIVKAASTPRYSGTDGTVGRDDRNYTDCTAVPGGIPCSDKNKSAIDKNAFSTPPVDFEKPESPAKPHKWACDL
jgi:hypothetical protein